MPTELPPLPTHRLAHMIAAFRGLARVVDPDPPLDGEDRCHLYFLLMVLTQALEACLHEITSDRAALHAALWQAQDTDPTAEESMP
jgi:hypothetical protein